MSRITKFKKIPLKVLIDALVALYDGGANYVDIMGESGDTQDEIGLSIKEEYMAPSEEMEWEYEEDDEDEEDNNKKGGLSEEGLNKLI